MHAWDHPQRVACSLVFSNVQNLVAIIGVVLKIVYASCRVMQIGFKIPRKVKASHTRYRALGPELIPVYRQSASRLLKSSTFLFFIRTNDVTSCIDIGYWYC